MCLGRGEMVSIVNCYSAQSLYSTKEKNVIIINVYIPDENNKFHVEL